ncbi:MAG: deoxyguanosinetriphosphate triphosphohydrolase, partial [Verrucomicrobiota bacterium]|nr:deoxyguanosinetriphosphate triphosphohydrolase [Verrucomicrobiota bacterium]
EELEARERDSLALYAQLSADSRGRSVHEPPPEWRTQYQRDRDRIIHSRAFRRLDCKTQVFLSGSGDHLRTRLTHTMEVAAIARNIARALRLNEDLTEAIGLGHDLGHSPFGHSGEEALDELMRVHGGFEHNRQSRRVVELLEHKYPAFPGLNLTWETLEGLAKHDTAPEPPLAQAQAEFHNASLEAQVANLADEITYYSHDLDDGLDSGLLTEAQLDRDIDFWRDASERIRSQHGDLADECRHYFIIRCLIDDQVHDVVQTTEANIAAAGVASADDVRTQAKPLVAYSPARREANLQLRAYLYENLYYNNIVHEPHIRAATLLGELFHHYEQHPEAMGDDMQALISRHGLQRAICDHLACMTDRFVVLEHERLLRK